jgi:two-component system cell cycle sensor histidine kinase/response regulator CckA
MEVRSYRNFATEVRCAGYLLVSLGAVVLVGWLTRISPLLTVLPGRIAMKPNTALGFLCAGVSILMLMRRNYGRRQRLVGLAFAAIVFALGLLTIIEYGLHVDLRIDQLLFKDPWQWLYPGRMAPISAINFCLVGLSLFLLSLSPKQARWPQILSLLTGLSALLAIVGYLYGVPLLYGSVRYTSMALHTGVGFLLLSVSILHCRPSSGLMSAVNNPYVGGWLARRLIPFATLVPIGLGAVCIYSRQSLADIRLALAFLILSQAVLFVALIWTLAARLNRFEIDKDSIATALHKSEEQLEQNYRSLFQEALIGLFQTTPDNKFINVNPAMASIFGYESPQQMISAITDISKQVYVDPDRREQMKRLLEQDGVVQHFECQLFRKDGSKIWISTSARAVTQGGKIVRYDGTFEDITERKLLEDQLRQAQKMEAVGQLAGGVAHDFNNAIGVIVGYSALLKDGLSSNETLNRYADEIDKAGHRAASLTRQLLAFSRKQVIQPTVVDLNALVAETEKMLRRLIGEDIELVLVRTPGLGRTRLDVGQVDQILMNLAVNARDAMTSGGKLVIELSNAELDETNLARRSYAKPGSYVMLSVSDTGCGMDKETQNHIFEPFFTTKGPGQGTGLGLSTVYGIVKQSEGYIWVYSEPGKGTTFKIYFPRIEAAAEPIKRVDASEIPRGSETILVVEDDEAMRALTRTCLESGGYSVLDVSNGEAAIRAVTENGGAIHLMVTDVIMPGISGRQLAESVLLVRPKMKVLYISGYTADLIARQGILEKQVALLEKPFTKGALLRKVREILDGEQLAKSARAT